MSFTERPRSSKIGMVAGGIVCAVGQLSVVWAAHFVAPDSSDPGLATGYMILMSVPVGVIGFITGGIAATPGRPGVSAAIGAILSALPIGCCLMESGTGTADQFVAKVLPIWLGMIAAGGLGGWVGGVVGRSDLKRKLQPLEDALAAREQAEVRQVDKPKEAKEVEREDRCLACGHSLESHVTCPACGWTYL